MSRDTNSHAFSTGPTPAASGRLLTSHCCSMGSVARVRDAVTTTVKPSGFERGATRWSLVQRQSRRSGPDTTNAPRAHRDHDYFRVRTRTCRRAQGARRPSIQCDAYAADSRLPRRPVKVARSLPVSGDLPSQLTSINAVRFGPKSARSLPLESTALGLHHELHPNSPLRRIRR